MASSLLLAATLLSCMGMFVYFRLCQVRFLSNPGLYLALYAVATGFAARKGLFLDSSRVPPPLMLFAVPVVIAMVWLGLSRLGAFKGGATLGALALLSIVRIPVEFSLHSLAEVRLVPYAMTWSGTNFDVFSGVTAPIVAWLVFTNRMANKVLIAWNVICLILLMNVVGTAILSIPFPFQMMNFEHPNLAVLRFPYALLPIIVVPAVLFSHVKSLRILLGSELI